MAEKPRIQDAGRAAGSRSSRDAEQPRSVDADPASAMDSDSDTTPTTPGQLARDDRGNISWEWSDDPSLLADDVVGNTARLRALAPKHLAIEDEDNDLAAVNREPIPARKTQQPGYNPYNSGEPIKQSWKKKRDLRELGRWIALKKRMRNPSGED